MSLFAFVSNAPNSVLFYSLYVTHTCKMNKKIYKIIMWHKTSTSLKSPPTPYSIRSFTSIFSGICCMLVFKPRPVAFIFNYFNYVLQMNKSCFELCAFERYIYISKGCLASSRRLTKIIGSYRGSGPGL